jgi:hypothetical protein
MRGYLQPNIMPLSHITIASLTDLGYVTTMFGADSYTFLTVMRSMVPGASDGAAMSFGDDIATAPRYEVARNGSRHLVRPALK